MSNIIPIPRVPVSIRPATLDDIPFMDGFRRRTARWWVIFRRSSLKEVLQTGGVLVAEEERVVSCQLSVASEEEKTSRSSYWQLATNNWQLFSLFSPRLHHFPRPVFQAG